MTPGELLRGLNVYRSLGGYLQTRFGLALILIDADGSVKRLNEAGDDDAFNQIVDLCDRSDAVAEGHHRALATTLENRSSRPADYLAGLRLCAFGCDLGDRNGRLVVAPFGQSALATTAAQLGALGVGPRAAEALVSKVPVIDDVSMRHIRDLCALLSRESEAFFDAMSQVERRLDKQRKSSRGPSLIVGGSAPMQALFVAMDRIARSDTTIYIHGENGTGKELVAAEIHQNSRRSTGPFVIQNCSAFNDNLLESEMFGHKRGAFTGASLDKQGLFELADGGTFFLDEIGDMTPQLQVKLLRVLQEGTFLPVGDTVVRTVDVRVICATNKDLEKMVADGTFREDLYYRINVIGLRIPPLRERPDDIEELVDHFLLKTFKRLGEPDSRKRFTDDAMDRMREYDWPGNVRELENEIERIVVMSGPLVTLMGPSSLSAHIRTPTLDVVSPLSPGSGLSLPATLEEIERTMIYEALTAARWNKTRAAEALGVSRRNLIRKVVRYGFDRRSS